MRRLIDTAGGRIEVVLDPAAPAVEIAVFDADGRFVRSLEGSWYAASHLEMYLLDAGVDEEAAPDLAKRLAAEREEEAANLPPPRWVPAGCLGGTAVLAATAGIWLVGVAFLVWLVVRAL